MFNPPAASVAYRAILRAPVAAYIAQSRRRSMWRRGGTPSSRADIYIKLQFSDIICPILASARCRHPPSASLWPREFPHPHIFHNAENIVCGAAVWMPKFLSQYLPKTEVPSDVCPILASASSRHLPSGSTRFRRIPLDTISSANIVGI